MFLMFGSRPGFSRDWRVLAWRWPGGRPREPASRVRREQRRRQMRSLAVAAAAATTLDSLPQNTRRCRPSALLELQFAAAAASVYWPESDVHGMRESDRLPHPMTPRRAPRLKRRQRASPGPSMLPVQSSKPASKPSHIGAQKTCSQHAFPLPPRHDDSTFKGDASSAPIGGERGSRRSSSLWR